MERKQAERAQVSPGTGFFGGDCCITFVSVLNRYSLNSLCYALRLHFPSSGIQQVQNNTNPRDHDDMTRPSCSAITANRVQPFAKNESYLTSFSAKEFHIAFREQFAIEIWALKVQRNYQIFIGALRKIKIMLPGIVDAQIIALEILSGLDYTQMVLLSCATEVTIHDSSALKNYSISNIWTEEKQADFSRKFTCSVPGSWDRRDILNSWDKLLKVSQPKKN